MTANEHNMYPVRGGGDNMYNVASTICSSMTICTAIYEHRHEVEVLCMTG